MKAIIVDDEKIILLLMHEMLSGISDIEIVGTFQTCKDALIFLTNNRVDVAFVDIHFQEESGLDLARSISTLEIETGVVFVTGSTQHAIEAFDVDALDYIVKPITPQRLQRAIAKALHRHVNFSYRNQHIHHYNSTIYCLGRLEILNNSKEKVKWISSKSEEVFFYLLHHQGRIVSRHAILEDVFHNILPENAKIYLNTTIYQIRKSLDQNNIKAKILSFKDGYCLELENCYVDLMDFEKRVKQIVQINSSNIDFYLETEKIYSGDLYGNRSYIWSLSEQGRILNLYERFSKNLVNYLLGFGNISEATRIIKKLIRFNVLDEEANGLMMQVYAIQRDKTSLVKHYEGYVDLLKTETKNKPSKFIANLYAQFRKDFL